MNIKKILIVIGFIIFVFGIGFALYWVFFRTTPIPTTDPSYNAGQLPNINEGDVNIVDTDTRGDTGLPWENYLKDQVSPVANGGLTSVNVITDDKVSGMTKGLNGLQYYNQDEQKFFRINENGEIEALSDKLFYQVSNVTWDNNGDKAILEYPDGSNILYNFKTGKQVTLPPELEDFAFNSGANKIAAKWIGDNEEDNWMIAANDDGSGMFLIEPLGDQSHQTFVDFSPDNQIAIINRKYIDVSRQEIFPIGLHGETFKSFTVNGAGFTFDWSPEGNSMVYSVYNESSNYNPSLWVTKGRSNELGDLKVSLNVATWPEKCTFAGESAMYCAVPQGLPRGAGFYPEIANKYPDNFYYIDFNSDSKTLIAKPVGSNGSYAAYNLFTSLDGSVLYFTDAHNNSLQSIQLE